jgi:hypothetical protein
LEALQEIRLNTAGAIDQENEHRKERKQKLESYVMTSVILKQLLARSFHKNNQMV